MNIERDKTFITGKIELDEAIRSSFNNLGMDQYTDREFKFRSRSYSLLNLHNENDIEWKDNVTYLQTKEINAYAGSVQRNFCLLREKVKIYIVTFINEVISKAIDLSWFLTIVHQIQTCCDDDNPGYPSPEEFDYIFIINYGSKNIEGTTSFIQNKAQEIVLERKLEDGKYLFLTIVNMSTMSHLLFPCLTILDFAMFLF